MPEARVGWENRTRVVTVAACCHSASDVAISQTTRLRNVHGWIPAVATGDHRWHERGRCAGTATCKRPTTPGSIDCAAVRAADDEGPPPASLASFATAVAGRGESAGVPLAVHAWYSLVYVVALGSTCRKRKSKRPKVNKSLCTRVAASRSSGSVDCEATPREALHRRGVRLRLQLRRVVVHRAMLVLHLLQHLHKTRKQKNHK